MTDMEQEPIEPTVDMTITPIAPRIEILSFAVELPTDIVRGWDEPILPHASTTGSNALDGDNGVVGTVVVLKNAIMIWFGWGSVLQTTNRQEPIPHLTTPMTRSIGLATNLSMGPLFVGMPRNSFQGAFSATNEGSTSKLVGSDNDISEMIARQTSSRLSQRLGIPAFVSCSFDRTPVTLSEGVDEVMIRQRAAALAEKEVARILQEKNLI